jgi:mRNA interferase MazF
MATAKGEVHWADLGAPAGRAPAKRRPVVVIQSDHFNRSRLATVIVAAITSNTALADHPGNVFLSSASSGLPRDSVVNVSAIATIDRSVLLERVGALPSHLVAQIDDGVRLVLDL